ncbi:hypothetical protein [Methylobacterium sp. WL19]|uniref:hypothetical protein n=1 Tax=Methylobacterium sp. WL19 TaxID=2603896 RepID=UPI0011CAFAA5|nr:hypothetical protein [Methylobacterium sp. WL19]TXN27136.1 hypothetical protein FV220_12500 [Methylobacterium sp. WL19]
MAEAVTRAEAAAVEQRRLLIETDDADPAALKRAGDACRKTADDRTALEDAARVLTEMVAEAQARVAAEQDRVVRERVADAMERQAEALATCISAEERAVQALAEAHQATRLAAYGAIRGIGPMIDAESLIGEVKAVALHVAYPMEFSIAPFSRSLGAPCSTLGNAASTYLSQLRSEAEAIRSGAAALPVLHYEVPA